MSLYASISPIPHVYMFGPVGAQGTDDLFNNNNENKINQRFLNFFHGVTRLLNF